MVKNFLEDINYIGFSNIEKLLVINLFLCPYMLNGYTLQNDLGYFSCVYGVVAYYNMMVLEFIMILRVLALKEFKSKKTYIWIAVSLVAMCFTGASDGPVLIVMALVPAIAYVVIKALIENDKHVFVAWKSVYLYASFCAVAFGRVLGAVFNLPYQEDVRLWTTANQLWSNIGNLLCGYMMLLGAIPGSGREYSPLEMRGFCFVFGLIIFLVILISFMYWLIKLICAMVKHKKFNEHILFLLAVVLVDFVEFSLVYTSYGEDIFETRYLIISTMAAFVLVGYFVKDLADSLLFKKFGVVVLFVAIIGCDLMSDYLYKINTNESWQVDEILDDIKTTDAGLVYTWGKELTPIERCLRVYDNQRVYKAITKDFVLEDFGDYSVYDDSTQYQGPTILVVSKNEPAAPDEILKKYELISSNDQVDVYYCKSNPIDIQYWVSYGKKLKEGNN